ncbi:hypothetical protein HMPREF3037_01378 [Candidatus Stoquefichus sp. KLE1796]|nr:hypothetical protein HMPREF3037_01378 [Candidatus Stoquefichus sp. KLE1796]
MIIYDKLISILKITPHESLAFDKMKSRGETYQSYSYYFSAFLLLKEDIHENIISL